MPLPSAYPKWLTAPRLRAQGFSLAFGLWAIYALVLATPGLRDRNGLIKGTDFLHFYTLGALARAHRGADLYDIPQQTRLLGDLVPAAAHTVYLPLYGPQISLIFAPLAGLSYGWALFFWLLCSTAIYAACVYAIWKTCPHLVNYPATVIALAVAYPGFFNLIAWGQTSALALACFTAAYLLLRANHHFSAGLVLGCLMFKPQLAIVVAIVFLITQAWRVVAGALITSMGQLLIGWAYYGTQTMRDYANQILHIPRLMPQLEPKIDQTHCLRTFWEMLVPSHAAADGLYIASAVFVLWLTVRCWRSALPLDIRYSALLLATVLVSPHLTVYDLVILAPALLLISDRGVEGTSDVSGVKTVVALYLVYLLPILGFLARWTHLQLSVIAIFALLWIVCETGATKAQLQPA